MLGQMGTWEGLAFADMAPGLHFRRYSLLLGARVLLRDGEPVALGGRAFDLLYALLCARGKIVERADLMRQIWPTTVVEESNLRFQVACARRALGADRDLIKSVPGRGYFFVAEPDEAEHEVAGRDRLTPTLAPSALPQDPTGVQTPEDYRASCELLRELLSAVLHELRELRGLTPTRAALPPPNHLVNSD